MLEPDLNVCNLTLNFIIHSLNGKIERRTFCIFSQQEKIVSTFRILVNLIHTKYQIRS